MLNSFFEFPLEFINIVILFLEFILKIAIDFFSLRIGIISLLSGSGDLIVSISLSLSVSEIRQDVLVFIQVVFSSGEFFLGVIEFFRFSIEECLGVLEVSESSFVAASGILVGLHGVFVVSLEVFSLSIHSLLFISLLIFGFFFESLVGLSELIGFDLVLAHLVSEVLNTSLLVFSLLWIVEPFKSVLSSPEFFLLSGEVTLELVLISERLVVGVLPGNGISFTLGFLFLLDLTLIFLIGLMETVETSMSGVNFHMPEIILGLETVDFKVNSQVFISVEFFIGHPIP